MPSRSTLADANKRRSEFIFEAIYRNLYDTYHSRLYSDSRTKAEPKWMERLQINDSFMLNPNKLSKGDIMAMDRAYIDYEKLETMTHRGVIYVTKMKKNLKYKLLTDTMYQTPGGLMEVRIQHVSFTKLISLLTNDMKIGTV